MVEETDYAGSHTMGYFIATKMKKKKTTAAYHNMKKYFKN